MGRYMKQYDKENLKMSILRQEATFRQQVHELHRLYHVQQLMMREMKHANKKIQLDAHIRTLDLELSAEEFSGKQDRNVMLEAYQESDLELTLATGSSRRPKKRETSSSSDSGSSFSSSSTGCGATKPNSNESGLFQVPEMDMGFAHDRHNRFKVEEQTRQDGLPQPPWLSQCLSLNTT